MYISTPAGLAELTGQHYNCIWQQVEPRSQYMPNLASCVAWMKVCTWLPLEWINESRQSQKMEGFSLFPPFFSCLSGRPAIAIQGTTLSKTLQEELQLSMLFWWALRSLQDNSHTVEMSQGAGCNLNSYWSKLSQAPVLTYFTQKKTVLCDCK